MALFEQLERGAPAFATLSEYVALADALHAGLRAEDPGMRQLFRELHPRYRRADAPWLTAETGAPDGEATLEDARLAVARAHMFLDWDAVVAYASAVSDPGSPARRFETAVEAVIDGDRSLLESLLRDDPALVWARSERVNCFDPPVHRATLLHYLGANGVENQRQRTPANAVEIARVLLEVGAVPDATADFYGELYTTMCLLASSGVPAGAGLQVPLIEVLVEHGASVRPAADATGRHPLRAALVFDQAEAAAALVDLGAPVDELSCAAGLGWLDRARELLPAASPGERHRALALAAQHGKADVVRLLLDAGEDPSRYNPGDVHSHATPLHHAALNGHEAVVHLLVERGAALDLRDRIHDSTPEGWADHAGHAELAAWLRERAAG